ncbi:hypothetical protein EYV94_09610 [Puteibacter caeruleilacunae]|nr:hypothetical protein EYV94_09610 [Puteibacter caeruleilacunae]
MKQFGVVFMSVAFALFTWISCSSDEVEKEVAVDPGNDPNFKIEVNNDGLKGFNRKVEVFGIDIYAVKDVDDAKLLHAANVMAQYLDNDEDGNVDNQLVLDKMIANKAFVVMWKKESDLEMDLPNGREGQDLGNDETIPGFVRGGKTGTFDASLEEIWHIITHAGYAYAYPEIFGEQDGSEIANAMDIARGGKFTSIPNKYPANAWYSYDDTTCEYDCQVTEYFYWAMSSMLGAQENRLNEIGQEWKLNTRALVESKDQNIFNLLTAPDYKLPTVLPDGSYKH